MNKAATFYFFSILLYFFSSIDSDYFSRFALIGSIICFSVSLIYSCIYINLFSVFLISSIVMIFLLLRGTLLLLDFNSYFPMFYIDANDYSWLGFIIFSMGMYVIGASITKKYFERSGDERSISAIHKVHVDKNISYSIILIGAIFWLIYIYRLGGVSDVINNFSASQYFVVVESVDISTFKNISIYCLIGGLLYYSASLDRVYLSSFFIFIVVSFFCIFFIKREYLFECVLIFFLLLDRVSGISKLRVFSIGGVSLLIILFSLYLIRSSEEISVIDGLRVFDTAEFWMVDQFIQFVQVGDSIYHKDYGLSYLMSFAAPFMSFSDYVSIDLKLTEVITGIERWGIPATILGYWVISFGFLGGVLFSFVNSVAFTTIEMHILNKQSSSIFYRALYGVFMIYLWFVFRNGDPFVAVFFSNRFLFVIIFILIISSLIKKFRSFP